MTRRTPRHGREQPFNAERVQALGAGLALPMDAEPAAIADGRSIVAAGPGAANGANIVERIADARA